MELSKHSHHIRQRIFSGLDIFRGFGVAEYQEARHFLSSAVGRS